MDKVDKVESTIGKGVVAGFVATFVLSMLLDPIALFAPTVWPGSTAVGWVVHFFVGTVVWGVAFSILHDYLRGPSWQRGLVFALGAWLVVMGGAAALDATQTIAFSFDAATIAVTLTVHVLYGVLLGVVYGWLLEDRSGASGSPHEPHGEEPHPVAR
jgi:uncharacterized membrane protein YagU involved in acid resistance